MSLPTSRAPVPARSHYHATPARERPEATKCLYGRPTHRLRCGGVIADRCAKSRQCSSGRWTVLATTLFVLVVTVGTGVVASPGVRADAVGPHGSPMPFPAGRVAVAWAGDAAYLFGGTIDGQPDTSDAILRYDPAGGTFSEMNARLPVPLEGASAVWDGTFLYVIGGVSPGSIPVNTVYRYDPASDTLAALPGLLQPLGYAAAAWNGRLIYIYGGWHGCCYSSTVYVYDPASGPAGSKWPGLPQPIAGAAAAHTGFGAYLVGGVNGDGARDTVYDVPDSGPVTQVGILIEPTSDVSAIWNGNHVVAFGGLKLGVPLGYVTRFAPCMGQGVSKGAALPSARSGTSAFWTGTQAYVLGGRASNGQLLGDVLVYDHEFSAPTNLTVVAGPLRGQITVTWSHSDVALVTDYNVYRASELGEMMAVATTGKANSFLDTGLPDNTTFRYAVSAKSCSWETNRSIERAATTAWSAPTAPLGVAARPWRSELIGSRVETDRVRVNWSPPPDDGGLPASTYRIYRATTPGQWTHVGTSTGALSRTYIDSGIVVGPSIQVLRVDPIAPFVKYYYAVSVTSGFGMSPFSAPACVMYTPEGMVPVQC